jgi:hypothetical protein
MRRRMMLVAAATLAGAIALTPRMAVAEGLFELFFGGVQKQQQQKAPPQANFFADPFGLNPPQPAPPPRQVASGSGPAFCVRSCDGRYFPLTTRGNADSDNAYTYRKAMRADCTCNGRDPAGLAPVDLTLDTSLRPGDVIATTSGLVAYSGVRTGINQSPEFTPVASYPGLTADVRARLGEMKVAPVAAEMLANDVPMPDAAVTVVPKSVPARGKRAEAD